MLSVIRVHLPSEIPIVGCELTPYVLLRRPDKTPTSDDVPESAPLEGHFLKYRWLVIAFWLSFTVKLCFFLLVFAPVSHGLACFDESLRILFATP